MDAKQQEQQARPWWKHGHVWLLISGPAAVIVAGVVTMFIAVSGSDKLVAEDYYRRGVEINKQLAAERALLPAQQGRNHAATPARP
ncbi:FixH family protein [Ramlibacter albus]|uniref:FixH family protein n=1 Tax=Ramlibacter albus TaxID=2079448 RepID=A0A923S3W8_9BURK|nr:FixH family protein [Ramlibacter albus]MBC5766999.1 FixH family protein [Ramlibacter albus]